MKKGLGLLLTSLAAFIIYVLNPHWVFAAGIKEKIIMQGNNDTPWQIIAENIEYMEKEGLIRFKGLEEDVLITNGYLSLFTREAIYDRNKGTVEASGNIRFETGEDILTGENGVFNLNDQTGSITEGRLFLKENHYYISGDLMEKIGEDTYRVRDFRLTTCDGTDPFWSITGSEVIVTIEGYGMIRNAAFRVREIPFFYLPYMIFPAKTKRQTGFLPPGLGYSDRNGVEMEIPFFWAISDQTDATFYERFMSRRGLMQGIELRNVSEGNSKGTYLFDILRDKIEKKDLNNPEQTELGSFARTNRTRYWLRSRTDQHLPGDITARMDTDVVSDQDYLKEFRDGLFGSQARPDLAEESGRPVEEINSPYRRSALRLSRDNENYSIQALASYYQRPEGLVNDPTPQPLAGIDLTILPMPLFKLPLGFSLDIDYDYIWRDFGQRGHSVSISPRLTYPTRLGSYLEFEPSISVTRNMQWLDNYSYNIDSRSRNVYQFQARLSTILERVFDIEWEHAKSLRHKLVPSFIYEYRSHKDETGYTPWFEAIDAVGKLNRITFSVDNFIDVKKQNSKGDITYSQWASLNLTQAYDPDESHFEPLTGILTLMPFHGLDLDAKLRWDHDKDQISYADLSLEFDMDRSGGRQDTYEIDYVYLDEGNKGLRYYLNVNLARGFSLGSSLQRDMDLGHNIEKSYWIEYMAQCWGTRLTFETFDEESRIMLTFHILGLGT